MAEAFRALATRAIAEKQPVPFDRLFGDFVLEADKLAEERAAAARARQDGRVQGPKPSQTRRGPPQSEVQGQEATVLSRENNREARRAALDAGMTASGVFTTEAQRTQSGEAEIDGGRAPVRVTDAEAEKLVGQVNRLGMGAARPVNAFVQVVDGKYQVAAEATENELSRGVATVQRQLAAAREKIAAGDTAQEPVAAKLADMQTALNEALRGRQDSRAAQEALDLLGGEPNQDGAVGRPVPNDKQAERERQRRERSAPASVKQAEQAMILQLVRTAEEDTDLGRQGN
jgi:hypothetical protein